MTSIDELQKQIEEIQARNQRVDADNSWETINTRKLVVLLLTYIVVSIFFLVSKLPRPFLNAIVPSVAFVISTLTLSVVKRWWLKHTNKP